ncbi:ROK family glucokinase [Calidifontibacillus erzurumensis]|uniref:Glucokinase n=1 Tax=Calidifontibacillus erzurumensis TaxID=2741433 RepID=A0A8J8GAY0_9BACI|nr:ROK family glucokinase [Calidifontibacillus erzurumensis]NSL50342.1 ROK family glucokinase [Calidifontibacillus erzurumensis]
MEPLLVGVDVGGTTVKLAFVSDGGEILHKWSIATDKSNSGKNIITDIASSILNRLDQYKQDISSIKGVGVGAPAFLDMETGFVHEAVNLGWKNINLKKELEHKLNLPVVIDNDANTAALGEMWKGAGVQSQNLLCITIGTGIGGGIIINGEIVHGINGMAGEIGHFTVLPENGALCNCGKKGCLETISSATGMVRLAREEIAHHPDSLLATQYNKTNLLSAKMIIEAARKNDDFALEIVDKASFYLGLAIANIAITINPEKIVIGGGVSKAGSLLLKKVSKYFKQFALPRVYEGAHLALATLGNDAGVIGAAWLAKNKL